MASSAQLHQQIDLLDEQHFLNSEFERSNLLMNKISEQQGKLAAQRTLLEKKIMAKEGVADEELWVQLHATRQQLDYLYDEKMMLVAKLFHLAQRFVQELTETNIDIETQIQ